MCRALSSRVVLIHFNFHERLQGGDQKSRDNGPSSLCRHSPPRPVLGGGENCGALGGDTSGIAEIWAVANLDVLFWAVAKNCGAPGGDTPGIAKFGAVASLDGTPVPHHARDFVSPPWNIVGQAKIVNKGCDRVDLDADIEANVLMMYARSPRAFIFDTFVWTESFLTCTI